ncbi:hypothetical protein EVAR_22273_1 [Eumeta japonica]|uniref:Histone-lysine N-methyltransferase SETMAR n=1 Tax=Eumeta variegata TaxID=151549 RepID=A0A4C1UBU8_EUMVA|nr:hypothetical protein EVAR_22273_1 [Eumeta japonica]
MVRTPFLKFKCQDKGRTHVEMVLGHLDLAAHGVPPAAVDAVRVAGAHEHLPRRALPERETVRWKDKIMIIKGNHYLWARFVLENSDRIRICESSKSSTVEGRGGGGGWEREIEPSSTTHTCDFVTIRDKSRPHRVTNSFRGLRVRMYEGRLISPRPKTGKDFLELVGDNIDEICDRIVTVDETWVRQYDPESKQESMQWTKKGEKPPKKFKVQKSASKLMATIFWDSEGRGSRTEATWEVIARSAVLQDNASVHTARVSRQALKDTGSRKLTTHPTAQI